MENRRKFYDGGLFGNDDIKRRYDYVCWALDAYKEKFLDWQDLTVAIKNAFVSKVYVSCGVVKAYPNPVFGKRLSEPYSQLVANGILDLQDNLPNLRGNYFRICECGTKVNRSAKAGTLPACIHIEHTVPGDVYMKDAINLFNSGKFDLNEFMKIFNAVSICLVTKGEDKLLNKYKDTMPHGVKYKQAPFARYDATGVKIWKRCAHCNQCPGYVATGVKNWKRCAHCNQCPGYDATGVKNRKHCAHCNQCPGVTNCQNLTFMTQPISLGSSQYWINPKDDTELLCSPTGNSIKLNGRIFDLLLSGDKNHMEIYTDHGIYVLDLQGKIKRIKP